MKKALLAALLLTAACNTLIQGFTQNRISGTGSGELGNLMMQPFTGEVSLFISQSV